MHPPSSRAFQRHQEHNLKHPGSVDLITTKQNKLPSFIDRSMVEIRADALLEEFENKSLLPLSILP
jgi:hypothetical protein